VEQWHNKARKIYIREDQLAILKQKKAKSLSRGTQDKLQPGELSFIIRYFIALTLKPYHVTQGLEGKSGNRSHPVVELA
jgi:hypothetical protein